MDGQADFESGSIGSKGGLSGYNGEPDGLIRVYWNGSKRGSSSGGCYDAGSAYCP
jgi:hypothetical protein